MADLRNFAIWDPGVSSVRLVEGAGPGLGAGSTSTSRRPRRITLRYETTEFQRPDHLVVAAATPTLVSLDEIVVEKDLEGATVTYDAECRSAECRDSPTPCSPSRSATSVTGRPGPATTLAGDVPAHVMSTLADIVDRALELAIVPSFTRIGCAVRSRLDDWTPVDQYDLDGRVVVVTGATSDSVSPRRECS